MRAVEFLRTRVNPDQFRRGFGLLGYFVYLINLIRMWLEYLIVLFIAYKSGGYEKGVAKELKDQVYSLNSSKDKDVYTIMQQADEIMSKREEKFKYISPIKGPSLIGGTSIDQHARRATRSREAMFINGSRHSIRVIEIEDDNDA